MKPLALLCAVNFMVILDSQITLLAVPQIQDQLGFSADGVQWVISSYLIGFGGLLLLGGRAGDLLGRRRVFIAGAALFAVSSLLCGVAWSPGVLVGARVLQGISAAVMAPTALAILMTTFPDGARRNRALAYWGAMGGLGATAALVIGGALTEAFGWRSIFFLNLPVAALMLALAPALLEESQADDARRSFDVAGAAAITAAVVALIVALVEVPSAGWLSAQTLGLLAVAVALLGGFAAIESRSESPLVPLDLFRSRALVGGNLVMLLVAMTAFGMGLTLSHYAQQALGYTPLQFGLAFTAMTVMTLLGSAAGQAAATRGGPWPVAAVSALLLAAGSAWLAMAPAGGSYWTDILPGLVLFGPGLGAGTVAGSIAALDNVPERLSGAASGTNTAAFQLGGALGTTVVSTLAAGKAVVAGSHSALHGCVVFALLALVVAAVVLRGARMSRV